MASRDRRLCGLGVTRLAASACTHAEVPAAGAASCRHGRARCEARAQAVGLGPEADRQARALRCGQPRAAAGSHRPRLLAPASCTRQRPRGVAAASVPRLQPPRGTAGAAVPPGTAPGHAWPGRTRTAASRTPPGTRCPTLRVGVAVATAAGLVRPRAWPRLCLRHSGAGRGRAVPHLGQPAPWCGYGTGRTYGLPASTTAARPARASGPGWPAAVYWRGLPSAPTVPTTAVGLRQASATGPPALAAGLPALPLW